jgi:hypothetical protein
MLLFLFIGECTHTKLGSMEDMLKCFKLVTCTQWKLYEFHYTLSLIIEFSTIPANKKRNDMPPISVGSIDYKYVQIIKTEIVVILLSQYVHIYLNSILEAAIYRFKMCLM